VKAVLPVLLRTLEGGSLEIIDGDQRRVVEASRPDRYGRPDLHATIRVVDQRAYTALLHGSSGLGEAYRKGWYTTEDLTSLLRLLARAVRTAEPLRDRLHRLARPVAQPIRRRRSPDAERDRADIGAHYDLGNDFFALFLGDADGKEALHWCCSGIAGRGTGKRQGKLSGANLQSAPASA
jgi:cyclopropane-fatty-acyl-phospholipid synthase